LQFYFITADPEIARYAVESGVDWILVDLETLGKSERQGHLDTVISKHNLSDVAAVRSTVPAGTLVVRTNPLNSGTAAELDQVISAGADAVMLPYFQTVSDVRDFVELVAGRAAVILLAETIGAMRDLAECCGVPGVDRIHIGLNDLSLELRRRFMFELLVDGTVDRMASVLTQAGMPFGIGGLARVGEGLLPAEAILVEHRRLGSGAAILSRTFHRQIDSLARLRGEMDLPREIERLRLAFATTADLSGSELENAHRANSEAIATIAAGMSPRPLATAPASQ
jgi:2-keto-3-deoxy-L-rhamnonate aldolase RhmA